MARHRDIRNMDYRDDYDGYDDIYGHSVDDDYCISPSNRQYLYNRESSTRSSESDIKEEDEVEAQLSDLERAKLESCLDQIKSTLGALSLNRNKLVNIIILHDYNIEKCISAILEESSTKELKEKDLTKKQFIIPKLNGLNNVSSAKTTFVIPNLFNKNSQNDATLKKPNFIIPSFGKLPNSSTSLNFSSSPNEKEFKSLSEMVSNHLQPQLSALNDELKNDTFEEDFKKLCLQDENKFLENEPDNIVFNEIAHLEIIEDKPLPCTFDANTLLEINFKLKKSRTKFAAVLCRKYKRPIIKLSKDAHLFPKRIKLFDFKIPSPDDGIKQYLKR